MKYEIMAIVNVVMVIAWVRRRGGGERMKENNQNDNHPLKQMCSIFISLLRRVKFIRIHWLDMKIILTPWNASVSEFVWTRKLYFQPLESPDSWQEAVRWLINCYSVNNVSPRHVVLNIIFSHKAHLHEWLYHYLWKLYIIARDEKRCTQRTRWVC